MLMFKQYTVTMNVSTFIQSVDKISGGGGAKGRSIFVDFEHLVTMSSHSHLVLNY